MDNIIQVKGLNKTYGKKQILKDVNLTLEKGQIYGLVGKNGVGKTTLMRIITGLAFKTSGEFTLFGTEDKGNVDVERHRVGTMIETPAFQPYMSAEENLEYYRRQRGIKDKTIVKKVLEEVGLGNTGNKQFKNFSLGMKQRLGLALALLNDPELLILDEPINGLDPEGIAEIRNTLRELNQKKDITILISSHILSELASVATYYGFMKDGTMVEEISANDLEEKCRACIEITVNDQQKAATLLEGKLNCTNYEILPEGKIRIYQLLDCPEKISEVIVMNGIQLSQLEAKRADLEQYFLKMLGGEQ